MSITHKNKTIVLFIHVRLALERINKGTNFTVYIIFPEYFVPQVHHTKIPGLLPESAHYVIHY